MAAANSQASGRCLRAIAGAVGTLLIAGSAVALGAGTVQQPARAAGMLHILTQSDNGTTLTLPVGDSVELKLDTYLIWNVTISNPTVLHRPPIALVRDVQGFWDAAQPGSSTINATGDPVCRSATPSCAAPSLFFTATVIVTAGPSPSPTIPPQPGSVAVAAGWNLLGGPSGATLPVDAFSWNAAGGHYDIVTAGTPLIGGNGYWAYFAQPATVSLSGTSGAAQVQAPPLTWVMIGNPSAVTAAGVGGADLVYSWSPTANAYAATTSLAPGRGAWALSYTGSLITIAP